MYQSKCIFIQRKPITEHQETSTANHVLKGIHSYKNKTQLSTIQYNTTVVLNSHERISLILSLNIKKMASKNDSVLEQLMARSEKFGTKNKFPISTNLTKTLLQQGVSRNVLERNVLETYPLVHENVLKLMEEFIKWKKVHGNEVEKGIYNEQMTIPALIDRYVE